MRASGEARGNSVARTYMYVVEVHNVSDNTILYMPSATTEKTVFSVVDCCQSRGLVSRLVPNLHL
eukprot:COSAG01_NODE_6125_length_3838_cov_1.407328_7_plen_65_part_00